MATIEIHLPNLLASMIGEDDCFAIEADTLRGALTTIAEKHPKLALHVFDETGDLRRHVLCFYNDTNTRWLDSLDVRVHAGDALMFMQAVSGG